jgi:hypothetical protein
MLLQCGSSVEIDDFIFRYTCYTRGLLLRLLITHLVLDLCLRVMAVQCISVSIV